MNNHTMKSGQTAYHVGNKLPEESNIVLAWYSVTGGHHEGNGFWDTAAFAKVTSHRCINEKVEYNFFRSLNGLDYPAPSYTLGKFQITHWLPMPEDIS